MQVDDKIEDEGKRKEQKMSRARRETFAERRDIRGTMMGRIPLSILRSQAQDHKVGSQFTKSKSVLLVISSYCQKWFKIIFLKNGGKSLIKLKTSLAIRLL